MYRYDLHLHSKYSYDGALETKTIVNTARERGLDGIAITDHNTIRGGVEAKKYETSDFHVIIGSEIMTDRGEIIGLYLKEEIEAQKAVNVMKEIKQQNGIVTIPHPFDVFRRGKFQPQASDVEHIDCMEVFNARCMFDMYNRKALQFANKHNLGITAGSDGHLKSEIGNAGILTPSTNVKKALVDKKVEFFGTLSSPVTHLTTKLQTWLKKLTSS